jgi:hypothetical protein
MIEHLTRRDREALVVQGRRASSGPYLSDELSLLVDLLAEPSTWAEPRTSLEEDVLLAVAEARRPRQRVDRLGRRFFVAVVGAAAAVVAVVAGVAMTRDDSGLSYDAELSATALVPSAHGSAAIVRNDAGFKITLDAGVLPLLRDGEYYEAWLKDGSGAIVPIGTFSSSEDEEYVTLWAGVSPDQFSTISVTMEPADNDPASSGQVVLAGPIVPRSVPVICLVGDDELPGVAQRDSQQDQHTGRQHR